MSETDTVIQNLPRTDLGEEGEGLLNPHAGETVVMLVCPEYKEVSLLHAAWAFNSLHRIQRTPSQYEHERNRRGNFMLSASGKFARAGLPYWGLLVETLQRPTQTYPL